MNTLFMLMPTDIAFNLLILLAFSLWAWWGGKIVADAWQENLQ